MRELTATLLAAQKKAAATPFVRVEAVNKVAGVTRYAWSRLFDGTEDEYYHALAVPVDGSLNRFRITPPSDSGKLYRQRVAAPGPGSNFSQWTYSGQYDAVVVAAASLGEEISLFWIKSDREIMRVKSTDCGASWGGTELLDYSPTTSVYGIDAAYKPGGDLAIFFADGSTVYVKKCINGQWQAKMAWDRTTGVLSGVACVYGNDWDLLVTGKDTTGNFKVWSLAYGDGGDIEAGAWSDLRELGSAPFNGEFEFRQPYLDRTDTHRCFFVEKYTGTEAYSRPMWSHPVSGESYVRGLWREPAPFNLSSEYGLAMAHGNEYAWLTCAGGVWQAPLEIQSLDLTNDIVEARQETERNAGKLTVTLRNDDGRYAAPGQGELAVLVNGCGLDFGPGYITGAGNEYSAGQSYLIESIEHRSSGGKATVILYARDGWGALADWKARHQFRWNKSAEDVSIKDIIGQVLARAGLKLEPVSQSTAITGLYPDFTINSGSDGRTVLRNVLACVPDLLFIEGSRAYLINPLSSDGSVYSYGSAHRVQDGVYRHDAMGVNRVQVEGEDAGSPIMADSFSWGEINRLYERFEQVQDRNISLVSEAHERGQSYLRRAEIEADSGSILVPVNCGQQLYDVIDITDIRAGLDGEKKRVLGMTLVYRPRAGEYGQRLYLGAV